TRHQRRGEMQCPRAELSSGNPSNRRFGTRAWMAGPACRSGVLLEFDDTVVSEAAPMTRHPRAPSQNTSQSGFWRKAWLAGAQGAELYLVSPLPCGSPAMHLGYRQVAKPTHGVTTLRFALAARSVPDWDRCC